MPDLAIPTKTRKDNNQKDSEFDYGVCEWKENMNTVFVRRPKIEEGNKNIYSFFTYQFNMSLKTKLKVTKIHDKSHKTQDGLNHYILL